MTRNPATLATQVSSAMGTLGAVRDGLFQLATEGPEERPRRPPAFWQRDRLRWASHKYARQCGGWHTIESAGCLVCCVSMLAAWAGYDTDPKRTAQELDEAKAFVGDNLSHPSRVEEVFHTLRWHHNADLLGKHSSYINWRKAAVDLEALQALLREYPVTVEVDMSPGGAVQQHFVLAYEYVPDPDGGLYDDLLIADPWTGGYGSILDYFHPAWLSWCERVSITRVQRAVTGARVWEVLPF